MKRTLWSTTGRYSESAQQLQWLSLATASLNGAYSSWRGWHAQVDQTLFCFHRRGVMWVDKEIVASGASAKSAEYSLSKVLNTDQTRADLAKTQKGRREGGRRRKCHDILRQVDVMKCQRSSWSVIRYVRASYENSGRCLAISFCHPLSNFADRTSLDISSWTKLLHAMFLFLE